MKINFTCALCLTLDRVDQFCQLRSLSSFTRRNEFAVPRERARAEANQRRTAEPIRDNFEPVEQLAIASRFP